ncbi:MAG: endo alpha-1,4 polygalactosaminidase, partial [Verrucomicrobiales bacterium]
SYAYLSVVEVSRQASYAAELDRRKIRRVVENANWGSDSVDITSPEWKKLVIGSLAKGAVDQGFDGFFLDTVDSLAHLVHKEPERSSQYRAALIDLIKDLKKAYPDKKILVNRGFSLLQDLGDAVDGMVVESVFRTYNFARGRYEPSRDGDTEQLVKWIREIRLEGLPVAVIDYVRPDDRQLAFQTARRIAALDCDGFITTPALNGALLAPVRERVRRLLVLYGWDEAERPMALAADTMVAQRLQTPLEYMGYECEYLNVAKDQMPGAIGGKYAGVIFDAELEIPFSKELPYADWLLATKDEGVKVLFLANLPFSQEDARRKVGAGLGMRGSYNTVAKPDLVEIVSMDEDIMGFEAKVHPHRTHFENIAAPEGADVFLSLQCRMETTVVASFDPVYVADWGGALLDPYITFTASPDDTLSLFDPFKYLAKLWPADEFPAPDPTTRDGLRAFFSHIDGDGFASLSSLRRGVTCAAVVRDEILKRYPLPVTVSVVEANTRAVEVGLKKEDQPLYEELAREIFALPNVQAASHSYSHPYSWIKNDPDSAGLYANENLLLHPSEGYKAIDYEREIAGSTSYIERELLPPGKEVEIMLWSGNCRPPAEALAIVRRMGIENMNGGDTITTKHHPSLATVAPRTMQWGGELQIFAPNQNEFVYTNDWSGPFYGGFRDVIDTFQRTESPRRLKPVNIYYHFYSASRLGALKALREVYDWAVAQPLHDMTAAEFARVTRDSRATRIFETGDRRWRVVNEGALRTFRMPSSLGFADITKSAGVTGFKVEGDWVYVHTSGARAVEIVLSDEPAEHPRMTSSTAEIGFDKLTQDVLAFDLHGFRPAQVEFGGMGASSRWQLNHQGAMAEVTADPGGKLSLELPAEGSVNLTRIH